jgi:hypothetical protein
MEKLTQNDLEQFVGRKMLLITLDGDLLRNQNSAFYMAANVDEANAFCERVRKELPAGEYEFSALEFELNDLTNLNQLFDRNYPGFEIVNYGFFVESKELYKRRPEVVAKVESIYGKDNWLYVPLNEDGSPVSGEIGNTHVSIMFYTNEQDAEAAGSGRVGDHTIERWIIRQPLDTAVYAIDDQVVYGWEISEATHSVWNRYVVSKTRLQEILEGKTLQILAADDGSSAVMRHDNMPIFFITRQAMEDFAEANIDRMSHTYVGMEIAKAEGITLVADDREYSFLDDDDSRYVCRTLDLLEYFENNR